MRSGTTNFDLNKYEQGDNPGAAALNANWDTIDEVLGEAAGAVAVLESAGFLTLAVEAGLPASKRLQGTANQVVLTPSGGDLVLSLPQNIHTAATPQFAGATFTGSLAFSGDNTHDLTAVGSRPRDVYAGRKFIAPAGSIGAQSYSFSSFTGGFYDGGGFLVYSENSINQFAIDGDGVVFSLKSDSSFGWSSGDPANVAQDLILSRVSAGTGKVANGANACAWRVHGDATKYTEISHDGANAFVTASSGTLLLFSAAAYIGWDGTQLFPSTDNGQALGKTTNRYSVGYFGTSVIVGPSEATVAVPTVGAFHATEATLLARATTTDIEGAMIASSGNTAVLVGAFTAHDLVFVTSGTLKWRISAAGNFTAEIDNTYDFGAAGAARCRSGFFGTSISVGTNPASAGAVRVANNTSLASRNAANTADLGLIYLDASDVVQIRGDAVSFSSSVMTFVDAYNIALSTTTGTKFGTATTQKMGWWNATPIVQPSSTGEATGYTGGGGTALTHTDTFTGNSGTKAYTLNDIVKHLKAVGILAAS